MTYDVIPSLFSLRRTAISSSVPKLEAAAELGAKTAPPDSLALRLAVSPDRLARCRKLLEGLASSSAEGGGAFVALPASAAALGQLHSAMQATLLEALLAKVGKHSSYRFVSYCGLHLHLHSLM